MCITFTHVRCTHRGNNARHQPAHQEQLGVQCLVQGHIDTKGLYTMVVWQINCHFFSIKVFTCVNEDSYRLAYYCRKYDLVAETIIVLLISLYLCSLWMYLWSGVNTYASTVLLWILFKVFQGKKRKSHLCELSGASWATAAIKLPELHCHVIFHLI